MKTNTKSSQVPDLLAVCYELLGINSLKVAQDVETR